MDLSDQVAISNRYATVPEQYVSRLSGADTGAAEHGADRQPCQRRRQRFCLRDSALGKNGFQLTLHSALAVPVSFSVANQVHPSVRRPWGSPVGRTFGGLSIR